MKLQAAIAEIEEQLTISCASMREIARNFKMAMVAGLEGRSSPLKMLPSFIGSPNGDERGRGVAIDFGGTNVRVLLVELCGNGLISILDNRSVPLKDKNGRYNYIAATASGVELFDFIADNIAELVPASNIYPLGHTFSFPCRQYGINQAELLTWTKEIKTVGVEGQDIGQLLKSALKRKGIINVKPQAIINDTTGTLITAAYTDKTVDIAAICGTGHNSCYLEPTHPLTGRPMVVNMESGNFDGVPQTTWDIMLDQASEKPGAQKLEKMASGQYLGEIVRLILHALAKAGQLTKVTEKLLIPYSLPTEALSTILSDDSTDCSAISGVVKAHFGLTRLKIDELNAIRRIAELVTRRSAQAAAVTWAGVLLHLDPDLTRPHTIAVDGSLYERVPGYAEKLNVTLQEILGEKAVGVTTKLSKDGSGIGAAIAAATAYNKNKE